MQTIFLIYRWFEMNSFIRGDNGMSKKKKIEMVFNFFIRNIQITKIIPTSLIFIK